MPYPSSESDILFIWPLHPCHINLLHLISYLFDLYTLVISTLWVWYLIYSTFTPLSYQPSESDILFIQPLHPCHINPLNLISYLLNFYALAISILWVWYLIYWTFTSLSYPPSESDILFIGSLHPCHAEPLSLISYLFDFYTLVISSLWVWYLIYWTFKPLSYPASESDILFIWPLRPCHIQPLSLISHLFDFYALVISTLWIWYLIYFTFPTLSYPPFESDILFILPLNLLSCHIPRLWVWYLIYFTFTPLSYRASESDILFIGPLRSCNSQPLSLISHLFDLKALVISTLWVWYLIYWTFTPLSYHHPLGLISYFFLPLRPCYFQCQWFRVINIVNMHVLP